MKLNSRVSDAFTLTEVIISMLVVGIIGASAWTAISVLNPSTLNTSNRIKAENLLTKSQEQVYKAAQLQFDTLEACYFPREGTSDPDLVCGFEKIGTSFPGFTRTLDIVSQGTTELKGSHVTVSWVEAGQTKSLDSMVLLARPKGNLPGNLIGKVINATTGQVLDGVTINLVNVNNSATTVSSAVMTTRPDGTQINYNFAEPVTNRFVLNAGSWRLTATKNGYASFSLPEFTIDSNQEVVKNFSLTPLPTSAHVKGRLLDPTGSPVVFNNFSEINLYENGQLFKQKKGGRDFDFEIPFSGSVTSRTFTLATVQAYASNVAGDIPCGLPWTYNGWSSSVVNGQTINCASSWTGGQGGNDRVTVAPGDNMIMDIPLVRVPKTTIQGLITNQYGQPITGAQITVTWHNNFGWPAEGLYVTGADGRYSVTAPAEQGLFPNESGFWAKISVTYDVPATLCCEREGGLPKKTDPVPVGPLFPDATITKDFQIPIAHEEQDCGKAHGVVIDDRTQAPASGVTVRISSLGSSTSSDGQYAFNCTGSGQYPLLAVPWTMTASSLRHYQYTTEGNNYYTARGPINIVGDQDLQILPNIGLWPIGQGIITGTILNAQTNIPVSGVSVKLSLGTVPASSLTAVTNSNGVFTFGNVPETWPPPQLAGNPRYNQTVRRHTLTITITDLYEGYSQNNITLQAGEVRNFEIRLIPRGTV